MKTKNLIKTTFISLIAFFVFFTTNANNSNYTNSNKLTNYLEKHVDINYDETKENLVGLVVIDFTFTKQGELKVNQINYSNSELKNLVLKELEQLCEKNKTCFSGKSFIYKFKFVNEAV